MLVLIERRVSQESRNIALFGDYESVLGIEAVSVRRMAGRDPYA